jgi:hypothetical protein
MTLHPQARHRLSAFSLTETVIALGLFAFCILGVLAMIPVGMNSARGVVNESTVVNLSESFFGAWQVAPTNASTFPIPGIFPANQQPVPLTGGSGEMYFLDDGTQTDDELRAAIVLEYDIEQVGGVSTINLDFLWPVTERGATNLPTQQKRSFTRVIAR